jgi:hypothetical protein
VGKTEIFRRGGLYNLVHGLVFLNIILLVHTEVVIKCTVLAVFLSFGFKYCSPKTKYLTISFDSSTSKTEFYIKQRHANSFSA